MLENCAVSAAVCAADVCGDPFMLLITLRADFRSRPGPRTVPRRVAGHHAIEHGTVLAAINATPRVRGPVSVWTSGVDGGCAQCVFSAFT